MRAPSELLNIVRRLLTKILLRTSPTYLKRQNELNFQRKLAELYKRNFEKVKEYWVKYRFLEEIENFIIFKNKKILDVGCGITSLLNHIEGERYGIDPLMNKYKKCSHMMMKSILNKVGERTFLFPLITLT